MIKNKFKIIKVIIIILLMSAISFCIYIFTSHSFVILGDKYRIYNTAVEELDLRNNNISSGEVKKIGYFTNLKVLNMRSINPGSIEFVKNMTQLENFQFGDPISPDNNKSEEFNYYPLCSLDNLKVLSIINVCNDDISFLKDIKLLEDLELSFSRFDSTQMNVIGSLKQIKQLKIRQDKISTLKPLENLNIIEKLDLNFSTIDDLNVSYLLNMTQLKDLEITDVYFQDIERLSEIKNLKRILIRKDMYTEEELKPLREKGITIEVWQL